MNLQPADRWFWYRTGIASMCMLAVGLTYLRPFQRHPLNRLPILICGGVIAYYQAQSMIWFEGVPYLYAVLIPAITVLLLQMSIFSSGLLLVALYATQVPAVVQTGVPLSYMISAVIFALVVVAMFRSRQMMEVNALVAEQERLRAQKKLIESQIELNEEIRAFLPREIYERVLQARAAHKTTVLQAMDDALRPRLKNVTCVFSDIRGFTEKSKDLMGFLAQSALPNIRVCTELVEEHSGIPRLIGDLIFSYFDADEPELNIHNALGCGFGLIDRNEEWNRRQLEPEQVRRFVLLSTGQAIVGNIGGQASSREITALGTPVNILSRIDPLTKHPSLAEKISADALIVTQAFAEAARFVLTELEMTEIDLAALDISIRDFPEETKIWLIPASEKNRRLVRASRPEKKTSESKVTYDDGQSQAIH